MRWLKSTTQKAWTVAAGGKQCVIPQNETSDNRFLCVGEDEYAEIAKMPVIAALIKAGGILVLDQEPAELKNSIPVLQVTNTQLQTENEQLRARVTELETQLKNATSIDIEQIKTEAVAAKQAEYDALKVEAEEALAEKNKEIARLEKKLKKSGDEE